MPPRTTRTHQVAVETQGAVTLDELAALVDAARRAHIPGTTVALIAGVRGAGGSVGFVHDYQAPAPAADPAPHPSEAKTEVITLPSIGDLR